MPDLDSVALEARPSTSVIDPGLSTDQSDTASCAEEATAASLHDTKPGNVPLIAHENQPLPSAVPEVEKLTPLPVCTTVVHDAPEALSPLPSSGCDAALGSYPVKPTPSCTSTTDCLAGETTPASIGNATATDEPSLASSGTISEEQAVPPSSSPSSQGKPPTGGRKRPRNGTGKRGNAELKLLKSDLSTGASLPTSSESKSNASSSSRVAATKGGVTATAASGRSTRMSSSCVHLPAEQARWRPKQGSDHRRLRGHQAPPTATLVLFGCSFERDSDMVRIEALLQADPTVKILSVSLHPAPRDIELTSLGILYKFFPERYEHVETNFREERGLKTLSEKIVEVGLPAKGYLDYAWLQTNYYKERPQGYGMNWLPMKNDSSAVWRLGKIAMLFEAGLMAEFVLPIDVGGNAQEMLDAYVLAARGVHGNTAPRLVLEMMTPSQSKKEGPSGHPLVCSDKGAARKLGILARDPDRQMQQFLDPDIAFYRITPWRACSEPLSKSAKAAAAAAAATAAAATNERTKGSNAHTPTSSSSRKRKGPANSTPSEVPPPPVLSGAALTSPTSPSSSSSSSRKQPPWPPPLRSELLTASGANGRASANDKKNGGGGNSNGKGKAGKGGSSSSPEPELHWSKMTPEEMAARWPGWKPKRAKSYGCCSDTRIRRKRRARAKAAAIAAAEAAAAAEIAKAKQEEDEAERLKQEQQRQQRQQLEAEQEQHHLQQRQQLLGTPSKRARDVEGGEEGGEESTDDDDDDDENDDVVLLIDPNAESAAVLEASVYPTSDSSGCSMNNSNHSNINNGYFQQQQQQQQWVQPMMTEPPRSGGHDSVYVHHVPTHGNNSHPTCNSSETNAALLSGPAGSSGGGKGSRKKAVALYCFCRRPDNLGKMVACEGENCKVEWFHFACVGLVAEPVGDWYCQECRRGLSDSQHATAATAATVAAAAVANATAATQASPLSAAAFFKPGASTNENVATALAERNLLASNVSASKVPAVKPSLEAAEISATAAAIPTVINAIPATIATLEAAAAASAAARGAGSARPTADEMARAEAVMRALIPAEATLPAAKTNSAAFGRELNLNTGSYSTVASGSSWRVPTVSGTSYEHHSTSTRENVSNAGTTTTVPGAAPLAPPAATTPAPAPARVSETVEGVAAQVAENHTPNEQDGAMRPSSHASFEVPSHSALGYCVALASTAGASVAPRVKDGNESVVVTGTGPTYGQTYGQGQDTSVGHPSLVAAPSSAPSHPFVNHAQLSAAPGHKQNSLESARVVDNSQEGHSLSDAPEPTPSPASNQSACAPNSSFYPARQEYVFGSDTRPLSRLQQQQQQQPQHFPEGQANYYQSTAVYNNGSSSIYSTGINGGGVASVSSLTNHSTFDGMALQPSAKMPQPLLHSALSSLPSPAQGHLQAQGVPNPLAYCQPGHLPQHLLSAAPQLPSALQAPVPFSSYSTQSYPALTAEAPSAPPAGSTPQEVLLQHLTTLLSPSKAP